MSISAAEVKKHRTKNSCWMVINNDVYDVTAFLNEHPGGEDALLKYGGKDGTQAFEDVGHSPDARELMKKFKIGSLHPQERKFYVDPCNKWKWIMLALAAAIIAGVAARRYYAPG
ncbi:cytochrome b5-like [Pectinophora gossypiella]|uniref:cytochrome b5-like n=1 Tax=Pectinophora gossypiella TaxID=13191 RepID=UPI00214E189A|nr:cytochrome b5-like [Pectinophora gossypiella]